MNAEPIPRSDAQKLTPDQRRHLEDIVDWTVVSLEAKYRAGQQEHGGNLWMKNGMLSHIEAEVLDLLVYVRTLRKQLEESSHTRDAICGPAQE